MKKTEERLRLGFEKIDRDLRHLMDCFRAVLCDLGEESIAASLPWSDTPLPDEDAFARSSTDLLQAYTIAFQLLNMVEENAANQTRRFVERTRGLAAEPGLWGSCLARLRDDGWKAGAVADFLPGIAVEPVLTAHPTESKRITVMEQHRELYLLLVDLENQMFTPSERTHLENQIRAVLERLWRTGETLLEKPAVALERASLIHTLDQVFPRALRRADRSFADAWEATGWDPALIAEPDRQPRLRFGTWVGGDRDGHPLVTPAVTRETLTELRSHALRLLRNALIELRAKLALSALLQPAPEPLQQAIGELQSVLGSTATELVRRNPNEPWRQFISLVLERLPPIVRQPAEEVAPERYYYHSGELEKDLLRLRDSLLAVGARRIVREDLDPVLRLNQTFGFHLASLDIRQNSAVHDQAMNQILRACGMKDSDYSQWTEEHKRTFLDRQLESETPILAVAERPGPEAEAVIGAFREISRHYRLYGEEGIGSFILSMCRSCNDLLAIYFLAREAGLLRRTDTGLICLLPIVPLLETVADLRRGPEILDQFLDHPVTRQSMEWRQRRLESRRSQTSLPAIARLPVQQVMVGYSDSNKDSGILASQWALYTAQSRIAAVGRKHGCRIRFFHGRGGTVSRGAGPTHRFLEALPFGTIAGDLRLTEQGETIGQKFANVFTASYNLELLLSGAAYFSLRGEQEPPDLPGEMEALFETMAETSRRAYRQLLEEPGFMEFYAAATPLDALERSRIGSRPSRRSRARTLSDLRAIPWVFSWCQSRFFLTGWYGAGTALEELSASQMESLRDQLRRWPFLGYVMTNIETSFASTDASIMEDYASLVGDADLRGKFMAIILGEFRKVERGLDRLFGQPFEERRPRLARTIVPRAEALGPLHRHQIELLRRWRAERETGGDNSREGAMVDEILLTVNAIASGLRTTG